MTVLPRFSGELVELIIGRRFVAVGGFTPVMNSWHNASCGFSLRVGSHLRHRVMKSRKASSSHLRTLRKSLELGRRRLPFDDTVNRGFPIESKNSFFLVLFSIKCFSGGPKISIMQANCSCSFSPGKIGMPVYNSARIQPKLHMSMGIPYDIPRMTSGDR